MTDQLREYDIRAWRHGECIDYVRFIGTVEEVEDRARRLWWAHAGQYLQVQVADVQADMIVWSR